MAEVEAISRTWGDERNTLEGSSEEAGMASS